MLPTSTPTILSKDDEVQIVWHLERLRIGISQDAIDRAMGRPQAKPSQARREEYVDENMGRIISIAQDRLLSSNDGYVRIDAGEL
jgi:hypothetical protein